MTPNRIVMFIRFLQQHRRKLLWCAGLLSTYTLAGFFLLPWLAETQIQQLLQQRLQLNTQVERIYFNPFTFYLEVNDLQVTDQDTSPLLSLGNLHTNFQVSRLALLKLQFSELVISDFALSFNRDSLTQNTLTTLSERWVLSAPSDGQPTPEPTPESDDNETQSSDLIPLQILSLTLSNIQLHVTDSVPRTEFSTSLQLASAQINDFSTLPGERGENTLTIHFEENARMDWQGGFSVNPLDFRGDISLTDFNVAASSRYLQDTLPFQLDDGRLHVGFSYDINLAADGPVIKLSNIAVQLTQLSATEIGAGPAFFSAQSIGFENGELEMPPNSLSIPVATIDGIQIAATRNSDGVVDIQRMLTALTNNIATDDNATSEPGVTENPPAPWAISLDELRMVNNTLQFTDQSLPEPFSASTSLDASLSNFNNSPLTQMPANLTLELASGGNITIEAVMVIQPELDLAGTFAVNDLELNLVQAYLSDYTSIELQNGTLNTNLEFATSPRETLSLTGDIALSALALNDASTNSALFSLSELAIEDMSYSASTNNAELSEITLTDPEARIVVFEDGSTNISRSLETTAAAPQTATSEPVITLEESATDSSSSMPAIIVGRLTLNNASADFTDRSLPLVFNAYIEQLNGAINDISNNTSVLTNIELEGQVGEFGLLQLNSELDPFDFTAQSRIELVFTNIDLPSVTPYAIKFAGREIDEGDVDLDLEYHLSEGQLSASNQMVLSNLQLGSRIESPDAMDLPLDLALALLKDRNGVIDLEIPVTGDVNDPEFNFGPAIRRAITNILTNIVAAPFRLLGGLIGGDSDDSLDHIRFLPGRTDIAAPEQQVLQHLGEALLQRPQLILEVPLVTSGAADTAALQESAIDTKIEDQLVATDNVSAENSTPQLSLSERRTQILEALYTAASLSPALMEIRSQHTVIPEVQADQADLAALLTPEPTGQLDVLAYNATLRERLINAESISQSELDSLARSRADNVVQYLVTNTSIDANRVQITEAVESELDEDQWLTMSFDLTAQ